MFPFRARQEMKGYAQLVRWIVICLGPCWVGVVFPSVEHSVSAHTLCSRPCCACALRSPFGRRLAGVCSQCLFSPGLVSRPIHPSRTQGRMAPKKGEGALQKARRLEEQAVALAARGKAQAVSQAMKKHPKVTDALYDLCRRELKKIGVDIDNDDSEAAPAAAPATLALTDAPHNPQPDGSVGSEAAMSMASLGHGGDRAGSSADGDNMIKRIDQCTSSELSDLLSSVEEVVLSKHALKALLRPGQRAIAKEPLMQIMEFMLGLSRSHRLTMAQHLRPTLKDQLKAMNEANGRRAQNLRLPPVWTECGIYTLLNTSPPVVKICHTPTNSVRVVPECHLTGYDLQRLYIAVNWSEDSAFLAVSDGMLNLPLQVLFSKERMDGLQRSAKKRRGENPSAMSTAASAASDFGTDHGDDGSEVPRSAASGDASSAQAQPVAAPVDETMLDIPVPAALTDEGRGA